jgi:hypothetical protein
LTRHTCQSADAERATAASPHSGSAPAPQVGRHGCHLINIVGIAGHTNCAFGTFDL